MPGADEASALLDLLAKLGTGAAAIAVFLVGLFVVVKLRHLDAMNRIAEDKAREGS